MLTKSCTNLQSSEEAQIKAAGYIPVSSEMQIETEYGLDAHRTLIANFVHAKGWSLGEIFCDPGLWGTLSNRPALQTLMTHADHHEFDVVPSFPFIWLEIKKVELSRVLTEKNGVKSHYVLIGWAIGTIETENGKSVKHVMEDQRNSWTQSLTDEITGNSMIIQTDEKRTNWETQEIFCDPGLWGTLSNRPALQTLMTHADHHEFDVVIVHAIDRFYRDLGGLLAALHRLYQHQVTLVSITENQDFTTSWGKLVLAVLGALAEIYIDKLRDETKKGKKARARKGLWNGSIPLGYCNGLCTNCIDVNGKDYCPYFGQTNRS